MIRPGEWLPLIWGEAPPAFADDVQAQRIHDLILDHYNDIIAQLNRGRYEPIFEVDLDGSALWEIWIEGLARAMDLRPGSISLLTKSLLRDSMCRGRFARGLCHGDAT